MATQAEEKSKPLATPQRGPQKSVLLTIGVALFLVVIVFLLYQSTLHEGTDDAYVTSHLHDISSRVNNTVLEVLVDDNQEVKAGQVLVKLDPADYQVKLDQAKSQYEKAQADWLRLQPLQGDAAIAQQDFDNARSVVEVAAANYQDAKNQLSYCTIVSPVDGRIGHKQVESGNRVTIGGALMTVVQDSWVVGNFKETQLAKIKKGQKVEISLDAIPGKKFAGVVDSFSPGTGSSFALLPSDNATGNFTKIVQRVPVKILFLPDSIRGYEDRIVPGLSAVPSIDLTSK